MLETQIQRTPYILLPNQKSNKEWSWEYPTLHPVLFVPSVMTDSQDQDADSDDCSDQGDEKASSQKSGDIFLRLAYGPNLAFRDFVDEKVEAANVNKQPKGWHHD